MTGPTTELGRVIPGGFGKIAPWRAFYQDLGEYVPELQWPQSVEVYDRMLADAKLKGLTRSVELPMLARNWVIAPNGADEQSVLRLSDDLDLPIQGQDPEGVVYRRQRNRFSFRSHLRVALKALSYGFYPFEQVGEIDMEGNTLKWVLRKLAPRPPRTVAEINVAEDGGLESIKQNVGSLLGPPDIPVDRLVWYVWDLEAGNWAGRSMMRSCYRNWLIKDRLLRVDAIKHERSGVGMPLFEAPPGASPEDIEELSEMARDLKVTESGGGAVPAGTKGQLMGTTGSLPDTVASIRLQNEEMHSSFLAEFKNLGQGQPFGSYALGEVQYDFFGLALQSVESWIMEIFNPHMVEDWYDWNYGPESQPARLIVDEPEPPDTDLAEEGLRESDEDAEQELEQFVAEATAKLRREKRARAARRAGRRGRTSAANPSLPRPGHPSRSQSQEENQSQEEK